MSDRKEVVGYVYEEHILTSDGTIVRRSQFSRSSGSRPSLLGARAEAVSSVAPSQIVPCCICKRRTLVIGALPFRASDDVVDIVFTILCAVLADSMNISVGCCL